MFQDNKLGFARCNKSQVIKANSEAVVKVRVSKGHNNETLLLNPKHRLQGTNIVGARCLVTTRKNKTIIKLANPTDKDVHLTKSYVIADVHCVKNNNVFCFCDNCSPSTDNVSNLDIETSPHKKLPNFTDEVKFNINNPNLTKKKQN